ncbi:Alcohol dehydrogenase zinc-binding domain protein [Pseudomonas sp. JV551A1]|uniref:zinc-dependent alcohol dehydrogenase family protein n=1 Tax=Pseudomonas sp. JV551A1 TaxID=2078787 RepID=UPI00100C57CE|nr:zinc-dependent alcohol dehydrogenase family protein [Pseudomonas sp. JV551A1]SPO55756.1 Alcohol dehydrogenase zinc-binding domain protein [Pseudomonas sp. JV551A1]
MTKAVRFHRTGDADVLQIDEVVVNPPAAGEVQIEVKALGLNRAEIMYRTGHYVIDPVFPAQLGYEAAGIVRAVGAGVKDFAVGDTVSVIPSFSFAEYGMYGEVVNAPAHAVVKHPANLSFEEAAASWMMFVTAYGALVEYGNLQAGQTVLIPAASSSVGLAAIQIANMLGATPVALTRTSAKSQALLDAGAKHVIATQEQDVVAEVARITEGKGAHIAFDPVGGPEATKLIKSLAPQGFFFQYGALDHRDIPVPVFEILGKHLTIRGYELFEISTDAEKLARAKAFVNQGLAEGKLKPVIDKVFPFAQISDAHRHMESNAQIGKIVVSVA